MFFDPSPQQEISIEGTKLKIAEHPAAPGFAYGQEGRAAIVYKLESTRESYAFKVFKTRFRLPMLVSLAKQLEPFSSLPGLTVCRRMVLTPQRHEPILHEFPDLIYSMLMPWIYGPTWLKIVQTRQEITPKQSLYLAQAFARILSGMEQRGIAHCDLSGANLIVPALTPDKTTRSYSAVELVDVEQMFAPGLDHPEVVPSGSAGYAHRTVRQGTWENSADRFAGAVMLAEILGWCIPKVREGAWGESFFDPAEMQRQSRRFDLLCQALNAYWGNNVAQLFERAWRSELLAGCPTLGEWLIAIPNTVPTFIKQEKETMPAQYDPAHIASTSISPPLTNQTNPIKTQIDSSKAQVSRVGTPLNPAEILAVPPVRLGTAPAGRTPVKNKSCLTPACLLGGVAGGFLLLILLLVLWYFYLGDLVLKFLNIY